MASDIKLRKVMSKLSQASDDCAAKCLQFGEGIEGLLDVLRLERGGNLHA